MIPLWFKALELDNVYVPLPIRIRFVSVDASPVLGFNSMNDQMTLSECCDILSQAFPEKILLPIVFGTEETFHTNVLIINPILKTYERFEPYGQYRTRTDIQSKATEFKLNAAVDTFLENVLPAYCGALDLYKYIKTTDFCPALGLQSVEETNFMKDIESRKQVDFQGFCTVWSMLYAHLRVSFPSLTPAEILKGVFTEMDRYKSRFKSDEKTLKSFIRNYICYLENHVQQQEFKSEQKSRSTLNLSKEENIWDAMATPPDVMRHPNAAWMSDGNYNKSSKSLL